MLSSLDFMGPLKWPNILAVTLVPAASFAWLWGDFDDATAMRLYGPEQVGGVPLLVMHAADADPRSEETRWCVRTCAACGERIAGIELAYGGETPPGGEWAAASADGTAACATLDPAPRPARLWLRATMTDGASASHGWRLGGA